MSIYAGIFIFNEENGLYNGVTVKYDGYIKNGVGENLYKNWNTYKKALTLIQNKRTDIRILGTNIKNTEFFKSEYPERFNHFRNLTYDEMLNHVGNVSYLYAMIRDNKTNEWIWKVWTSTYLSNKLKEYFNVV